MLDALFLGDADYDAIAVAVAALLRHHYGTELDRLLAFVDAHRSYVTTLVLVALATHPSVRAYVERECHSPAKVAAFLRPLQASLWGLLTHQVTLEQFERAAWIAWIVA